MYFVLTPENAQTRKLIYDHSCQKAHLYTTIKSGLFADELLYDQERCVTNYIMSPAKSDFEDKLVNQVKDNPKCFWNPSWYLLIVHLITIHSHLVNTSKFYGIMYFILTPENAQKRELIYDHSCQKIKPGKRHGQPWTRYKSVTKAKKNRRKKWVKFKQVILYSVQKFLG
jgi:hypothetical protein